MACPTFFTISDSGGFVKYKNQKNENSPKKNKIRKKELTSGVGGVIIICEIDSAAARGVKSEIIAGKEKRDMKHIVEEREKNIRRLVLIVDDEPINRELLGMIVGERYDVIFAENGKQAFDLIRENQGRLSLVLLDLLMPEMNGYTLLELLRKDPVLHRIPVIVLTSEKSAEIESLRLGAVDFIPKPYDLPDVILARIARSIELAEDRIILNATETDALTGLYIREFFFIYVSRFQMFDPDRAMDAVTLDVNKLHIVNELKGREYGDAVLKKIADRMKRIAEQTDGIACRCDGGRFFLFIAHQEPDVYAKWYDEISEEANEVADGPKVTLRIGVYQNVDRGIEVEQSFDRATLACNTPHNQYGSKYALYDMQMREKEIYSEKLLGDMAAALEQKQFKVFYQPKYRITGDVPELCSAEALVRWFHPELGFVSPGAFIPLFETNGLINKLDRYVWREAAAQVRAWKEKFGVTIPVSVNVSRMDIYDPDLEGELLRIVAENGLKTNELYLEITESAYTENSEQIINTVARLRKAGFVVEMDDFGSGYSSLNMLATLPIDVLKLDMRFIRNICESEKDYRLVKLMINTASVMSIPTVAEGVETEEQFRLLKAGGCDMVQGYYFSKPLPAHDFEELIGRETKIREEQTQC